MTVTSPEGFRAAGVSAGLKSTGAKDVALVVNDGPLDVAAAVLTSNRVFAAPVAWTGLEWLRARLLTGFLMASLAHTQSERLRLIQIADVFGEYGVTFLIILVAASIADAWARFQGEPTELAEVRPRRALFVALHLAPAAIALVAATAYGHYRLIGAAIDAKGAGPTIALIQSNMPADFKGDRERDLVRLRGVAGGGPGAAGRVNGADLPRPVRVVRAV